LLACCLQRLHILANIWAALDQIRIAQIVRQIRIRC
jgi:hypothetical protein